MGDEKYAHDGQLNVQEVNGIHAEVFNTSAAENGEHANGTQGHSPTEIVRVRWESLDGWRLMGSGIGWSGGEMGRENCRIYQKEISESGLVEVELD